MKPTETMCISCKESEEPFSKEKSEKYLEKVKGWKLVDNKIVRNFAFENFSQAMSFVNKVVDLAENKGHHPDIFVYSWNKVKLELYTHNINGLSEDDFVFASKINQLTLKKK